MQNIRKRKKITELMEMASIEDCIERLNDMLRGDVSDFYIFGHLAQAYEENNEIEKAVSSFKKLLLCVSSDKSFENRTRECNVLKKKIELFVKKHRDDNLVKMAEEIFGKGCLNLNMIGSNPKPFKPSKSKQSNTGRIPNKDGNSALNIAYKNSLPKKAKAAYKKGNFKDALEFINEAERVELATVTIFSIKANILYDMNQPEEALLVIEEGFDTLPPESALPLLNIRKKIQKKLLKSSTNMDRYVAKKAFTRRSKTSIAKPEMLNDSELSEKALVFGQAKRSFSKGDLNQTLEFLLQAEKLGESSVQFFSFKALAFQRLQRSDEALKVIEDGLKYFAHDKALPLLNLKAQIYSSIENWREAANAYELLLKYEKKPGARMHFNKQLSATYKHLGEDIEARRSIYRVLKDRPIDQLSSSGSNDFEQFAKPIDEQSEIINSDDFKTENVNDIDEIDLPQESMDSVSPFMQKDIDLFDFTDPKIIGSNKKPKAEDAKYLYDKAEHERKKYGSRHGKNCYLYLEAAKAFHALPDEAFDRNKYIFALSQYASNKASDLFSELSKHLVSKKPDLGFMIQLRDSALNYYIETITLLPGIDKMKNITIDKIKEIHNIVGDYLRIQIICSEFGSEENISENLFADDFGTLFLSFVHGNKYDSEILDIVCRSIVSWGESRNSIWAVLTVKNRAVFSLINRLSKPQQGGDVELRKKVYFAITDLTGQDFSLDDSPKDIFAQSFIQRREEKLAVMTFFNRIINLKKKHAGDFGYFRILHENWQEFPVSHLALFETDILIKKKIDDILSAWKNYVSSQKEEKDHIIFKTRKEIETILKQISVYPTYWGRVGFEPFLEDLLSHIKDLEESRYSDLQPEVKFWLDPPVFHLENGKVVGGLMLENIGKGNATGFQIKCQVSSKTYESQPIPFLDKKVSPGQTVNVRIEFTVTNTTNMSDSDNNIKVRVTPTSSLGKGNQKQKNFTFEIESGITFSEEDIPWNEGKVPAQDMFKGRGNFIAEMKEHFKSNKREKAYLLYGLTRTGKTSVLRYFKKESDLTPVKVCGRNMRFIAFMWDLDEAKSCRSDTYLWNYFLNESMVKSISEMVQKDKLDESHLIQLQDKNNPHFGDWKHLISQLHEKGLFPVFLIDEFSYFREMIKEKMLDASFLGVARKLCFDDMASFVFAGTYDIKQLISDEAYGITGQLVHCIEKQISRIDRESAIKLIQVMDKTSDEKPLLRFSDAAIDHILMLTYRIPYFIQYLCRNCAEFSIPRKRNLLGREDIEAVVKMITGEEQKVDSYPPIAKIPSGFFQQNMHTPSDPKEFSAILTTICDLGSTISEGLYPRNVSYEEITSVWEDQGLHGFSGKLSSAIQELCEREVLVEEQEEGQHVYRISADLFRRWWKENMAGQLGQSLDRLKE